MPSKPSADRIETLAEEWRGKVRRHQSGEEKAAASKLSTELAGAANVLDGAARRIRALEARVKKLEARLDDPEFRTSLGNTKREAARE